MEPPLLRGAQGGSIQRIVAAAAQEFGPADRAVGLDLEPQQGFAFPSVGAGHGGVGRLRRVPILRRRETAVAARSVGGDCGLVAATAGSGGIGAGRFVNAVGGREEAVRKGQQSLLRRVVGQRRQQRFHGHRNAPLHRTGGDEGF